MSELKAGDVVWLKSGSPPLVVARVLDDPDFVEVCWYDDNTLQHMSLRAACFTKEVPGA